MDNNLPLVLRQFAAKSLELGQRNLALEIVCATMLVELARMQRDPSAAMARMTAQLEGTANAVADGFAKLPISEYYNTSDITTSISRVSIMAERSLG